MAITVKHSKTSLIADAGDATLVQPSDWNSDHTLTGLGTMAEQNANTVAITGGTMSGVTVTGYIPTTQKAAALGVATLDAGGTVPLSQIPASIQGGVSYQGTWNATTNTPTLSNGVGTKGYYYVVSVAGSTNLDGITSWNVGDWAIFNGTVWQKVDNTDAVTSVNGYTGTVVLTNTDISGFGTMSTQNANAVAITGGSINGTTIGATTATTGAFTTATASTSVTTPIVQASNSGGLSLKNSAGTTQISMGAGGGDNASINVSTNINGTNAQIDISPTGTGHVHINPTGVNSIQINPTYVGTMDNITIGATTPKAITGTTITATTFSGSGASLTSIPNSALVNSAITINGTSTSLGGSISVGTVTSVTGTSPVVSSGGNTPAISMPAATTSVSGYLTSTDWNTFNNKGSGTVTSVTGTAPVVSSGGATPAISMAAATGSVNGYLTSTDWTTFNGKYSVGGALGTPSSATLTNATGLPVGGITATGTPSASTYLRGDGAWSSVTASSATNLAGGALGSVPYQLLSGTTVFLAGNTTTTPQFLTSTGALGVATAPTYTGSTGSGNVVLATSPTLVTPNLGTPSAINLTNATSLPSSALPAGSVLQVVNATYGTQTSSTSGNTWIDVGLSATITPKFSTSKILVLASANGLRKSGTSSGGNAVGIRILRGASQIVDVGLDNASTEATANGGINTTASSTSYLDSPATTSATTYKMQFNNARANSDSVYVCIANCVSTITLMEIAQ